MTDAEVKNPVWNRVLSSLEMRIVLKAISKSSDSTREEVAENIRELIEEHEENQ
ncbi:MAG: hypothetical protein ABEI13_02435 [Candidatus Paceibacteria bacterium]